MNYLRTVNPITSGLIFSIFLLSVPVSAQDSLANVLIQLGYGYQQSIFTLANRYGGHGVLQGAIQFKKSQWEFGASAQYLFGSVVREDVLSQFRSPGGELIGEDHQIAQVDLRLRGSLLGISAGRSFPIQKQGSLVFSIQPGWLVHWIRFQNPGETFAPIRGEYRYGYDRLSAGFAVSEQLAYRYLSKNRLINFEAGIQFTQGLTKLKRNIQLDQPQIEAVQKLDGLLGLQAKWIIPIFSKKNPESIYY